MLFAGNHYLLFGKRVAPGQKQGTDPHESAPWLMQRYNIFLPEANSVKMRAAAVRCASSREKPALKFGPSPPMH